MKRLKKADAAVRRHEAERRELAEAIVEARLAGWRPAEVEKAVHYDRNHIGRIVKADGRVPLREPKRAHDDPPPSG